MYYICLVGILRLPLLLLFSLFSPFPLLFILLLPPLPQNGINFSLLLLLPLSPAPLPSAPSPSADIWGFSRASAKRLRQRQWEPRYGGN